MQKNSKTKPSNQEYFTLRGFVSAHTINLPAKFSWLSLSSLTAKTHKPLTITLPANKKMSGLLSYLPPFSETTSSVHYNNKSFKSRLNHSFHVQQATKPVEHKEISHSCHLKQLIINFLY